MYKRFFISISLILLTVSISAQKRIISGQVTSVSGEYLSGVYIKAEGISNTFTLSGENGVYKIELPKKDGKLIFSYTNMKKVRKIIGSSDTLNVVLTPQNYQKLRFGSGMSFGSGNLVLKNSENSISFFTTPVSVFLNASYRVNRKFQIQLVLENDINFFNYIDDIGVRQSKVANRIILSPVLNYIFPLSPKENHHIFAGLALQFQRFGFVKTTCLGLELKAGGSLFNYNKKLNTNIFISANITGGSIGNVEELPNFERFLYNSFRVGVLFMLNL